MVDWATTSESFRKIIKRDKVVVQKARDQKNENKDGGWRDYTLAEASAFLSRGITPAYTETGGVQILNQKCIRDGSVSLNAARRSDLDKKPVPGDKFLKPYDILVNSTGEGTLGRVGQIKKISEPTTVDSHVTILRPNPAVVEPRYLGLLVRSLQPTIEQLAEGSTGQTELSRTRLGALDIKLPPLTEQKSIAHILGSLDDKIENNRRVNGTLEAMAQSMFKSLFVDTAQNGLPKGWYEVPLPEAIEVNPYRPLRKGEVAPYLDMANMPTRSVRAIEVYDREFGSGMRFMDGDTLVARITPCLENGKTCFVDFLGDKKIGWGSTEYIVFHPKPPLPPEFAYFLARTNDFRSFAISNMTGTSGRQRVPSECFKNFSVVVPSAGIAERFGLYARVVLEKMKANDDESRSLAAFRDALLPKLLSGGVRVKGMGNIMRTLGE